MKMILILLSFLLPLIIAPASVSSQFLVFDGLCELGNYTANSTYQNNLKTLLQYAVEQASHSLFGNSSVDEGIENVNMIYNCRGDLNLEECHQCIQLSAVRIVTKCPVQKEAIFWHQECMLRYSPRAIFSSEDDENFFLSYHNKANVSDPLQYSEVVATTIDGLIEEAAYNRSKGGYAVGEGNVTGLVQGGKVYCYVQCTPDILGSRCERCLRAAFRSMAGCCGTNKQSVQFYYPSCQAVYSAQPFVLGSDPLQVSPPVQPGGFVPPPPPPRTGASTAGMIIRDGDILMFGLIVAVCMLFTMPA